MGISGQRNPQSSRAFAHFVSRSHEGMKPRLCCITLERVFEKFHLGAIRLRKPRQDVWRILGFVSLSWSLL
jgi:hypothetical protein